jgi:hypothetical protein
MKIRLLFVRLGLAATIFGSLLWFLIITPVLVAADAEPLGGVITGTATSYAYLPIVFNTAVETGVASLSQHADTFVTASIYGFLGFGLLLGVVGMLLPFVPKQDRPKEEDAQ